MRSRLERGTRNTDGRLVHLLYSCSHYSSRTSNDSCHGQLWEPASNGRMKLSVRRGSHFWGISNPGSAELMDTREPLMPRRVVLTQDAPRLGSSLHSSLGNIARTKAALMSNSPSLLTHHLHSATMSQHR